MTTIAEDYGTQDQAALEAVGSALADVARRLEGSASGMKVDKESISQIAGEVKALAGYVIPANYRSELLDSIGESVRSVREADAQRRYDAVDQERVEVSERTFRHFASPLDHDSPEYADWVIRAKQNDADLAAANKSSDSAQAALASTRFVRRWCDVCRLITERIDAPEGSDDPGYCMQCWGKCDYYKIDF